ncbi:MAG: hypothetical protein WBE11_18510, partial [Candidatus Aminicenantaceae bacterium]
MRTFGFKWVFLTSAVVFLLFLPLLVNSTQTSDSEGKTQQSEGKEQMDIQLPPPPFSEGIFPCSECHADMEVNLERRELEEFHDD